MDIADACRTIRAWNDLLDPRANGRSVPGGLSDAVAELRRFLEDDAGESVSFLDLVLPEHVLVTREGLQWVMRFVRAAEAIQAGKGFRRSTQARIASLNKLIGDTARRCVELEKALGAIVGLGADERAADEALQAARRLLRLYTTHLARLQSGSPG